VKLINNNSDNAFCTLEVGSDLIHCQSSKIVAASGNHAADSNLRFLRVVLGNCNINYIIVINNSNNTIKYKH